jgi:hypothetical protein
VKQPDSDEAKAAEMAIFILQMFSFLHYEGIAEEIFSRAAQAKWDFPESFTLLKNQMSRVLLLDDDGIWDSFSFREGIQVLLSFSLIKRSKTGKIYSVHRLVHSWSRDRVLKTDLEAAACSARGLLAQSITFQFYSPDYSFRRTLVPHIEANKGYCLQKELEKEYTINEKENFAWVYHEKGEWKKAEELYVQVKETRKRVLGAEHPNTLTSMVNLASIYTNQGRWKEPEELLVQVMET